MGVPSFGGLPPYPDFNDVTNKINELVQELKQLLLNLDTLNIRSLHAKVIEAETITSDKIQANAITSEKIEAGSVVAEKIDVDELSAITANLGHIISGLIESIEIYGSYISTNRTGYPKAEMSNTDNMFNVWASEGKGIQMKAFKSGSPYVDYVDGSKTASVYYSGGSGLNLITPSGDDITLNPSGDVHLSPGGNVSVWNWDEIKSRATDNTLQDEFDDKLSKFQGAVNLTFDPITRNLKLWSGASTLLAQVNIS